MSGGVNNGKLRSAYSRAMTFEEAEQELLRIAMIRRKPVSAVIAAAAYVGLHSAESIGRFLDAADDPKMLHLHYLLHRDKPGTKGIIE